MSATKPKKAARIVALERQLKEALATLFKPRPPQPVKEKA